MDPRKFTIFRCILAFSVGCCWCYQLDMTALKKDCDALREHFMSTNPNGADGGAIFQKRLEAWQDKSLKQIFLSQIISKYLKMFQSLKITSVQKNIDNIREELSKASNDVLKPDDQLLRDLKELQGLEMSDVKIQHKAAMELYGVFQAVDWLNNSTGKKKRNKDRRRRGSKI